jgi:hypothetical protein
MLGALIPVSDALRTTGGTELIASFLSAIADRLPALGALALIMGRGDGSDAISQQCGNRSGEGADCSEFRLFAWIQSGPVSDGGGDRGGMRLPDPDRPSVQPAGDGARRLQFQRLLEARPSALDHGRCRRRAADCLVLAVQAGLSPRGAAPAGIDAFFEVSASFSSVPCPCLCIGFYVTTALVEMSNEHISENAGASG